MGEHGYKKTTSDHCVFVRKSSDDDFIILLLYVDDMLIVGRNSSKIDNLKKQLSKSFAMKDLGPTKQILGIRICRDRKGREHWDAVKWILRYLRGTSKLTLSFGSGKPMLVGYTNSDLARDEDSHKPTSGYLITFSGGPVSR
ncbi:unnamed protein product [Fraxinus pennsylvanica]|uniref:Reverse transcriptase Ty1/copia-type domain-containing protein n=1 Tax=Fraxinus pennsylvanica TaxID=56036 RepID=A0AAD2DU20_9LAMI|nr:unnamed protein product [Fraxinus pennsylvanica]